jgi:membrane peptidoglycan carboxypeptidase
VPAQLARGQAPGHVVSGTPNGIPPVGPRRIAPLVPSPPGSGPHPRVARNGRLSGSTQLPERREPQTGHTPANQPSPAGRWAPPVGPGPSTATQPVVKFGRGQARASEPKRGLPTNGRPTNGARHDGVDHHDSDRNGARANDTRADAVPPGTRTGAIPKPPNPREGDAPGAPGRRGGSKGPAANPLDNPANATAARLIAEGRARMASRSDGEEDERTSRRDRRDNRFDPASLAAVPAELRERFTARYGRRRVKIAAYTPRQRLWHRLRLAALALAGFFVVLPTLAFFIGYLCFSIPTPDDAVNKQIATINFADGAMMAKIVPAGGNRIKISTPQLPKIAQHAVLSAEDRTFFSNPGFDLTSIARAAYKQLTGGQGGGSTITQQFVKQTLVGDEHSLWRKYKEMIIAVKISQQRSKEDILCDYLNAIYFGRGAYGIESASQTYFNTDVWNLNAAQAALLAGVIQSPSRWDPAINPQHAAERWNYVMDGMVNMGWLSQQQRDAARFPHPQPLAKTTGGTPGDYRGLILGAVRDELEQHGISEQMFNQEGLTVSTTIDPKAQQAAVDTEHKGLAGEPDNLRTSLVSIDPRTGAILAYFGGDNGVGLDYARVSKQPGSTFKPFVLLADLLQPDPSGMGTQFKGEPLPGLRNADGASCQVCDLKQAMTISNNVIYHELGLRVGPQNVANAAKLAGITSPMKDPDAGIALGDKEVTPVELASAYATIAAQGVYHVPHLVTKVTTSDDRVLYDAVDDNDRRFSRQVARNVIEAMLGVPTYDKLDLSNDRPVAAKTGTVQSYVPNQNNDAWTVGFTPQVATVVWIGTDQNTPIKNSKGQPISGADMPGGIWKSYMSDATASDPVISFGPFKPIGTPPAVVGTNDGFMADGTPSSSSSVSSGSPSPSKPPQPSSTPSTASDDNRVCDQEGCHSVGTNNTRDQPGVRDDQRESGDEPDDNGG